VPDLFSCHKKVFDGDGDYETFIAVAFVTPQTNNVAASPEKETSLSSE